MMVGSFQCSFVQDRSVVFVHSQDVVEQYFGLSKKVDFVFTESTFRNFQFPSLCLPRRFSRFIRFRLDFYVILVSVRKLSRAFQCKERGGKIMLQESVFVSCICCQDPFGCHFLDMFNFLKSLPVWAPRLRCKGNNWNNLTSVCVKFCFNRAISSKVFLNLEEGTICFCWSLMTVGIPGLVAIYCQTKVSLLFASFNAIIEKTGI